MIDDLEMPSWLNRCNTLSFASTDWVRARQALDRIGIAPADIRNEHLQNASLEHSRYTRLLGKFVGILPVGNQWYIWSNNILCVILR
jgi:hypothetical protein